MSAIIQGRNDNRVGACLKQATPDRIILFDREYAGTDLTLNLQIKALQMSFSFFLGASIFNPTFLWYQCTVI